MNTPGEHPFETSDTGNTGVKTVLLVEDDHDLRALLELALEAPNRRIVTAGDGAKALDLVITLRPDLLLTDWMLPGLSGIEVIEHMRRNEETAGIPVIMITIRDDDESRQRARDGGVYAFLTKPFRPTELQATVERALAGDGVSM
jgi:two-component system phosphate regulon response regulator PhoB